MVLLFSGAMVARLAWLQLVHGAENRARADENRIRLMPRNPIRGRLLDRHGQVLASSRLTYNLYIQPREVGETQWPALRDRLAAVLAVGAGELDAKRRSGANAEGFRIELARGLSPEQVLRFKEQAAGLTGAEVDVDILRSYPHGRLAAHVLGYTSGITEEEYDQLQPKGYRIRDRVGRSGVEKQFEGHLRGEWGGQQVEVNAAGEVQRILGEKPARAGKDLRLTLDLDLLLEPFKQRPGVQWWVGEHIGKFLHAASHAYSFTGDDRLKERMEYAVKELISCQLDNGYLGTYVEKDHFYQGDGMDWRGPIWDVWMHKYNLIGLLSYYQVTGDKKALEASKRAADLLHETFVVKGNSLRRASALRSGMVRFVNNGEVETCPGSDKAFRS